MSDHWYDFLTDEEWEYHKVDNYWWWIFIFFIEKLKIGWLNDEI